MINNPILAAVATEAAATDWPVCGVTVIAPLVSGPTMMSISWSHFSDYAVSEDGGLLMIDTTDLPEGIGVSVNGRVPDTVRKLPQLTDIGSMAIAAAWAHGAWDIQRVCLAKGFAGKLPPIASEVADLVRDQGYVTWYWRPMLRGPELRAKAHAKKDASLNRWTLGRDEELPPVRVPTLVAGHSVTIRLGKSTERPSLQRGPKRATVMQRGYLGRLLRDAGEDNTVPDDLTMSQASDRIDQLRGNVRPRKDPSRRATQNQITYIVGLSLTAKLDNPKISSNLTYDEAAAWIDRLLGRGDQA
ncbi:hypothetical protein ASD64_08855 [Mesorhizobium sp. Root157]|uniref:DUF3072 domain-containing protein n=1 Tax=Mesorhizobium sp. Root157 TaxID=1736477 RepID=UPI0006FF0B9B|nr:DUF3072 domain-containing protein [Mesorhizobium sp. Root157]KQZ81859.1 hypothetical protein ASD64_08855 [Mesorhizobium sp. Root157]